MGGKRLKFPARQKFRPKIEEVKLEEEEISEEEHKARVEKLRALGLIK